MWLFSRTTRLAKTARAMTASTAEGMATARNFTHHW